MPKTANSNTATTWREYTTSTLKQPKRCTRASARSAEFAYAGGGLGKGGQVSLYVDGKKVGEGALPMTHAIVFFSADDGCDVGEDSGSPVSQDYGSRGNDFNGTVRGVQLAIAEAPESLDHLVSPEEAIRIAMARQ